MKCQICGDDTATESDAVEIDGAPIIACDECLPDVLMLRDAIDATECDEILAALAELD